MEVVPRATERTAEELFNDCDSIVNSLASNVFAYAIGLFRAGWAHARPTYNVFTSQIRDEVSSIEAFCNFHTNNSSCY